MGKIDVAVVGVGNCCSALVQGVAYYSGSSRGRRVGLMSERVGGYSPRDIRFVAAIDVNREKVGLDLSEAIFQSPNNTPRFTEVPQTGVVVRKGPILDGLGSYVKERIPTDSSRPVNIQDLLKESGAEILVNLLPTGASRAARFYANEALRSGCAFVNATPSRLATDPLWRKRFQRAGLQLVGDDVKNQVGSTILHEALLSTLSRRGVRIRESYQLDIGGGMESLNALDRERYWIKRRVKIAAIRSVVPYRFQVAAGSSDYVEFMKNSRTSHFWIEGEYFGDARFTLDMTLDVVEGPACAAVLVDVVRAVKVAKDRGIYGAPTEICAYGFKMPPKRLAFDEASKLFASLASSRKR